MANQRERLAVLETKLESIDRNIEELKEVFKEHTKMDHHEFDKTHQRLNSIEGILIDIKTQSKLVNTQGLSSVITGIFTIIIAYFKGKFGGLF